MRRPGAHPAPAMGAPGAGAAWVRSAAPGVGSGSDPKRGPNPEHGPGPEPSPGTEGAPGRQGGPEVGGTGTAGPPTATTAPGYPGDSPGPPRHRVQSVARARARSAARAEAQPEAAGPEGSTSRGGSPGAEAARVRKAPRARERPGPGCNPGLERSPGIQAAQVRKQPGRGPRHRTGDRNQPRFGMVQSIGVWPWAATASLICVKGREPKNFFADRGEGWAPLTTACRVSSISGSFFCA